MIVIKSITIRNFMSVGQVTQSINFENKDLVLVLGENLDLGGNDSRNGVGKSTIVNALSYALYGSALTNIRKDNLINKTNGKNMIVTLEFSKDGVEYRVERGRRPNKFAFIIGGSEFNQEETDEAQGENRITQAELERTLGFSHTMFKNIVALNTYSEPFLSMKANEQREIIEQLLGITKLSEKAEVLKERLRETKDSIKEEEFRVQAVKEANKRIEDNIRSLNVKSGAWAKNHESMLEETRQAITVLEGINIDAEIEAHKKLVEVKAAETKKSTLNKELQRAESLVAALKNDLARKQKDLVTAVDQKCPTCGHHLDDEKHKHIEEGLATEVEALMEKVRAEEDVVQRIEDELKTVVVEQRPVIFYDDIEEAYNHRASLDNLRQTLEKESQRENPFTDQIKQMSETGLQEVSFETMNDLTVLRDHQDFLLKLLTSKDSFIRRKIIDQNLSYLNHRLEHYLEKIGLPHEVRFQSDLNVEIQEHGRDLDFDNLSRGERTRLILSLSWAFRDVYESLNSPISLLFIDELIDSGLDTSGVESSLAVLKKMNRDGKRNIFLISHRDELVGRVSSVLRVIKEGGFTSFDEEADLL
jgi:DNA repair exonuclease SbcCD ATPase subunit